MASYVSDSGIQGGGTRAGLSFDLSVPAGLVDAAVEVQVYFGDNGNTVQGVTVDGVAATRVVRSGTGPVDSDTDNDYAAERWIVTAPSAGTLPVVITLDGSAEMWGSAVVMEDVDPASPYRDASFHREGGLGGDAVLSTPVASDDGDLVLEALAANGTNGWLPASGQTQFISASDSDDKHAGYHAGASPTVEGAWQRQGGSLITASITAVSYQSPSGGPDPETLSPGDLAHGHDVDSPALLQAHVLAIDSLGHGHAAEAPALVQANQVVVEGAAHDHGLAAPALTQAYGLSPASALHDHAADDLTLSQAAHLAVQAALHAHTAGSADLVQDHLLSPAAAAHLHELDAAPLVTAGVVQVNSAEHAHALEGLTLSQAHQLVVQAAAHLHQVDTPALSEALLLTAANSFHAHAAEEPGLVQSNLLVLAEALHSHTLAAPSIHQTHVLAVLGALHGHATEVVQLGGLLIDPDNVLVFPGPSRTLVFSGPDRVLTTPGPSRVL